MPFNTVSRLSTGLIGFLLVLMCLLIGSCRTYYVFPKVEVTTETLSPPYRLAIQNDLATNLVILPNDGVTGINRIVLPPGERREIVAIAVKKLKVGGNLVPQITEGPYVEVESAGVGSMQLRTTVESACPLCQPCSLRLDVRHPSWFDDSPPQTLPETPRVTVCVSECIEGRVIFRQGPSSAECAPPGSG